MNSGLLLSIFASALLALPAAAWADRNPNFENDALPILQHQPGLVQFVQAHYVVKETGVARAPGTDDRAPQPPYIFSAKPRGASGPFYLRLLIQPGPIGHILKVADVRKLPAGAPAPETAAATPAPREEAPPEQPPADAAPVSSAPASSSVPTSSTPSGPVND